MTPFRAWRQRVKDTYFDYTSNAKRRCDPCGVETKANNPRCGNCSKRMKNNGRVT